MPRLDEDKKDFLQALFVLGGIFVEAINSKKTDMAIVRVLSSGLNASFRVTDY